MVRLGPGSRLSKLSSGEIPTTQVSNLAELTRVIPEMMDLHPYVVVDGPPCQDFSTANQHRKEGKRADLTAAFALIVTSIRPQYFVMANVPRAARSIAYARAKIMFRYAGFGLTERVLDASHYGAATARKRLILVGCLGECDDFLGEHLDAARGPQMTVADVLGEDFGVDYGDGRGKRYFFYIRGKSTGTRQTSQPAPTITGKTIVNGIQSMDSYKPKKNDVLDCKTLVQPTYQQFSLLQGFPPDWDWSPALDPLGEKLGKMNQMLANSIPPPMAEAVGRCVLAHSRGERPILKREFPWYFEEWLRERFEGKPLHDKIFRKVQGLLGENATGPIKQTLRVLDQHPALADLSTQRKSNLTGALRLHHAAYLDALDNGWIRQYPD